MTQDEKLDTIINLLELQAERQQNLTDQIEELRDAIADKENVGPGYSIDRFDEED